MRERYIVRYYIFLNSILASFSLETSKEFNCLSPFYNFYNPI